jgi:hypothetical protein
MKDGKYYIMLGHSDMLCLAGTQPLNGQCKIFRFPFIIPEQPVWAVATVQGWAPPNSFSMQYLPMSVYAHFGVSGKIPLGPFQEGGDEFLIHFDDVGDGLFAINNHDHTYVMDANGDNPSAGANVSPYSWNGGNNQRWRFVPAL